MLVGREKSTNTAFRINETLQSLQFLPILAVDFKVCVVQFVTSTFYFVYF